MNPLLSTILWLSNTAPEILRLCPASERGARIAHSITVLIPSLLAFFAARYVASLFTANSWFINGGALIWSGVILSIDRLLLAIHRPDQLRWHHTAQFAMRLWLAFLLGIATTHPLVLEFFKVPIDEILRDQRREEIRLLQSEHDQTIAELDRRITKEISALRECQPKTTEHSPLPPEQPIPSDTLSNLTEQIAKTRDALTQIDGELSHWEQELNAELSGKRSGTAGEGPIARTIRSQEVNPRLARREQLQELLRSLTEQRAVEANLHQAETEAHLGKLRNALQDQTLARSVNEKQLAYATDTLSSLKTQRANLVANFQTKFNQLETAPIQDDFITRTLAVHLLFSPTRPRGYQIAAIVSYIWISLILISIDVIPLTARLLSAPGEYDRLLRQASTVTEKLLSTTPPPLTVLPDLTGDHPVKIARGLQHIETTDPSIKSRKDLAARFGISESHLSTYFALLRVDEGFEEALLKIPNLSLDTASRVARVKLKTHRNRLLLLLHHGASQFQIRRAIKRLNSNQNEATTANT